MLIVDYSAIALSSMFSQKSNEIDENMIRHQILNSLRMYNKKYGKKYGQMLLAIDSKSWRKNVFAEYKASRSTNREKSKINWDEVWRCINLVREEITKYFPYKVIQVDGAEADDVIAGVVKLTQEFGYHEDVMIISSDKDFIQLQKYKNVKQFSPGTKKLVTEADPAQYLHEHIFRGDSSDGVPNVLSPDDTFIKGIRQKSLQSKTIKHWIDNYDKLESIMDNDIYRNFFRNRRVIDLDYIPDDIIESVIEAYRKQPSGKNSLILPYLISKRCRNLVACVSDFFVH